MSGFRKPAAKALLYLVVLVTCVIVFFPIYWLMVTSLGQRNELYEYPPTLVPTHLRLTSYGDVLLNFQVARWILNTVIVSAATTAASVVISTLGGYALSRFHFHGKAGAQILILTTQMIPGTLLVIPIYIIFRQLRLLDNLFGLVVAYTTFAIPFCIWMLRGFFNTIPKEIDQAARIDGCTEMQLLYHAVFPLAGPGVATAAIFSFIMGWDEFLLARVMMVTRQKWVASIGISSFHGQYGVYFDQISAASILISLPVVALFLFLQRYIVAGMTQGSVKG